MRRTQHGRARGNGKRVNQICHFGIMGGLAPLTGVPLAHRSYIQKHATTNISIPPGCEAGRRWMMGHNPYRKYLLSKNPVGAGRVDVIKKSKRKCNCGPRPRGDGSQVGTHIFAELTPSAYPGHTHPHGYPPHHHPHPYDPDGLCLTWRYSAAYKQCEPPSTCPLLDVGGSEAMIRGVAVTKLQFGASSHIGPTPLPVTLLVSSAHTLYSRINNTCTLGFTGLSKEACEAVCGNANVPGILATHGHPARVVQEVKCICC